MNPPAPAAARRPRLAITMGDPAGVGPEIIMKSLAHREAREICQPLVIGDADRLQQAGAIVDTRLAIRATA
jgi:4-hydroxy-L-threonine phosphate dehydrogenase PdxA